MKLRIALVLIVGLMTVGVAHADGITAQGDKLPFYANGKSVLDLTVDSAGNASAAFPNTVVIDGSTPMTKDSVNVINSLRDLTGCSPTAPLVKLDASHIGCLASTTSGGGVTVGCPAGKVLQGITAGSPVCVDLPPGGAATTCSCAATSVLPATTTCGQTGSDFYQVPAAAFSCYYNTTATYMCTPSGWQSTGSSSVYWCDPSVWGS
jgi:hypothetical protein